MIRLSHEIREYRITFYQDNKNIGSFIIATETSLQAEEIGRKMAGKNVTVKVGNK